MKFLVTCLVIAIIFHPGCVSGFKGHSFCKAEKDALITQKVLNDFTKDCCKGHTYMWDEFDTRVCKNEDKKMMRHFKNCCIDLGVEHKVLSM